MSLKDFIKIAPIYCVFAAFILAADHATGMQNQPAGITNQERLVVFEIFTRDI